LKNLSNKDLLKIFLLLFIGIIFASFGAIPYATELISKLPEESLGLIPSDFVIGVLFILQLSILAFIGLFISRQVNLGAPVLASIVKREVNIIKWKSYFLSAIGIGLFIGFFLLLADYVFYQMGSSISFFNSELPSWDKGLVGSFFGGIGEEIIYRLFFMSLLIWILKLMIRNRTHSAKNWTVWTAMIFAAILFALAHLPLTASLSTITPLLVIRALLLNSIAGIGFGYLYWKKGLLYTMITHFFADIALHVIAVLIFAS